MLGQKMGKNDIETLTSLEMMMKFWQEFAISAYSEFAVVFFERKDPFTVQRTAFFAIL